MAYGPKIIDHYENPRNVGNFGACWNGWYFLDGSLCIKS